MQCFQVMPLSNRTYVRFIQQALLSIAALLVGGTVQAHELAQCNQAEFATTLHAAPDQAVPKHAQAYWLDAAVIQWPGQTLAAQSTDRFVLMSSRTAALKLAVGQPVVGADTTVTLTPVEPNAIPTQLRQRFKFIGAGTAFTLAASDRATVPQLLRQQVLIARLDASGKVVASTHLQHPGALDALYALRAQDAVLGAQIDHRRTQQGTAFALWAPTATAVSACVYAGPTTTARSLLPLTQDSTSGVWHAKNTAAKLHEYYLYLVDVYVPGVGMVRNRVTDPYALSLSANSLRTQIIDLNHPATQPAGWAKTAIPKRLQNMTDMVIYELHVRDFSINDPSVPAQHRGKYTAFSQSQSYGMRHLKRLSQAGITDVHMLPIFDLATVPEIGCVSPAITGEPAGLTQQQIVQDNKAKDCFNWGYDPFHFTAPEGSFSTNSQDGVVRVRELRQMVQAIHRANLRVGMDVVYNHTTAAGQHAQSVLDRIVPGYYQRLNAQGEVERSTCCDNTATEHRMMGKLMIDSAVVWARDYKIDSFRFDLMGHQPRDVMVQLQRVVDQATGRPIQLIGEGWNFGEVANGARFDQAAQGVLNGTGIGTFSDRARDAIRGGGPADNGLDMITKQGYASGLHYWPNERTQGVAADKSKQALLQAADMVRVGLAGSLKSYQFQNAQGRTVTLDKVDYNGQPAGYVSQPYEVVNYVENHDNQTLFDMYAYKLPTTATREQRARAQMLALALNAFSQGVAYFHAGGEILRSKSLDRNSYDSGDWFNRIDWTGQTNYFATGLPPAQDNASSFELMRPLLSNPGIAPTPQTIAWTRAAFEDLLNIRASSPLFRLSSAHEIEQRLKFHNTGPTQVAQVIVGELDGTGMRNARFKKIVYLVNVDIKPQSVTIDALKAHELKLHPRHRTARAADQSVRTQARFDARTGRFDLPAQSAVVFVQGSAQ